MDNPAEPSETPLPSAQPPTSSAMEMDSIEKDSLEKLFSDETVEGVSDQRYETFKLRETRINSTYHTIKFNRKTRVYPNFKSKEL